MSRLFVYGSLMTGESNHAHMRGASLLGPARTAPAFTLHDLGPYPALAARGATSVAGELFDVPASVLARLDRFEGHPDLYVRSPILLDDGTEAQAYLATPALVRGAPIIASGDYRAAARPRA